MKLIQLHIIRQVRGRIRNTDGIHIVHILFNTIVTVPVVFHIILLWIPVATFSQKFRSPHHTLLFWHVLHDFLGILPVYHAAIQLCSFTTKSSLSCMTKIWQKLVNCFVNGNKLIWSIHWQNFVNYIVTFDRVSINFKSP